MEIYSIHHSQAEAHNLIFLFSITGNHLFTVHKFQITIGTFNIPKKKYFFYYYSNTVSSVCYGLYLV